MSMLHLEQNHPASTYEESLLKGSLLTILAFLFFALFGVFSKAATPNASGIWINFIAYFTSLAIYTPFILKKGFSWLKTDHFFTHFGRAFFGFLASLFYILSMKVIPLLNATLLFNTTPIFIPIFAIFMLHIRVQPMTWVAIFIGFIGIYLVINPNIASLEKPGDLVGLLSGIFLAIAFIFVKILVSTEPSVRIVYYFFLLSSIMQLPLLFLTETPSWSGIGYAVCGGLSISLAQLFITLGYRYAEASKMGVFQYSGVFFVGIIDWIIWGIEPNLRDILGTFLVVIAGTLIVTMPLWNKPKTSP